jgi:hypothetical protein
MNTYNLVHSYAVTNRLEEASAMIREAPAKQLDSVFLSFYLAFLNNDAAGRKAGWLGSGKPEIESEMLGF